MRIFLLLLQLTTFVASSSSQEPTKDQAISPPRYRGPAAIVYLRPGFDSLPVRVSYVTLAAGEEILKRGIFIRQIGIKNYSPKPVSAVRITWLLYKEEKPNEILLTGNTPLIEVDTMSENENCDIGILPLDVMSGRFSGAKQRIIGFPILTFSTLNEEMKKGKITDREMVEVVVGEVHFEDGTIWQETNLPQRKE